MGFPSHVFMVVYELRMVISACGESKETAVKSNQGVDRAWVQEHRVGARLEVDVHAARLFASGGGRIIS